MDNRWRDHSACKGKPLEWFFEQYEEELSVQLLVDEMCASCPVQRQCLEWAIENNVEFGVWGRKFFSPEAKKKSKKRKRVKQNA